MKAVESGVVLDQWSMSFDLLQELFQTSTGVYHELCFVLLQGGTRAI